jgi:hypothetical protein
MMLWIAVLAAAAVALSANKPPKSYDDLGFRRKKKGEK